RGRPPGPGSALPRGVLRARPRAGSRPLCDAAAPAAQLAAETLLPGKGHRRHAGRPVVGVGGAGRDQEQDGREGEEKEELAHGRKASVQLLDVNVKSGFRSGFLSSQRVLDIEARIRIWWVRTSRGSPS